MLIFNRNPHRIYINAINIFLIFSLIILTTTNGYAFQNTAKPALVTVPHLEAPCCHCERPKEAKQSQKHDCFVAVAPRNDKAFPRAELLPALRVPLSKNHARVLSAENEIQTQGTPVTDISKISNSGPRKLSKTAAAILIPFAILSFIFVKDAKSEMAPSMQRQQASQVQLDKTTDYSVSTKFVRDEGLEMAEIGLRDGDLIIRVGKIEGEKGSALKEGQFVGIANDYFHGFGKGLFIGNNTAINILRVDRHFSPSYNTLILSNELGVSEVIDRGKLSIAISAMLSFETVGLSSLRLEPNGVLYFVYRPTADDQIGVWLVEGWEGQPDSIRDLRISNFKLMGTNFLYGIGYTTTRFLGRRIEVNCSRIKDNGYIGLTLDSLLQIKPNLLFGLTGKLMRSRVPNILPDANTIGVTGIVKRGDSTVAINGGITHNSYQPYNRRTTTYEAKISLQSPIGQNGDININVKDDKESSDNPPVNYPNIVNYIKQGAIETMLRNEQDELQRNNDTKIERNISNFQSIQKLIGNNGQYAPKEFNILNPRSIEDLTQDVVSDIGDINSLQQERIELGSSKLLSDEALQQEFINGYLKADLSNEAMFQLFNTPQGELWLEACVSWYVSLLPPGQQGRYPILRNQPEVILKALQENRLPLSDVVKLYRQILNIRTDAISSVIGNRLDYVLSWLEAIEHNNTYAERQKLIIEKRGPIFNGNNIAMAPKGWGSRPASIYQTFVSSTFGDFIKEIKKQNFSFNQLLQIAGSLNGMGYNYIYKRPNIYDDLFSDYSVNSVSEEQLFEAIKRSSSINEKDPVGACRGIAKFTADLLNNLGIEAFTMTVTSTNKPHTIVLVPTRTGVAYIDGGNIIDTFSFDIENAMRIYGQYSDSPTFSANIYNSKNRIVATVYSKEGRLLEIHLTASGGISSLKRALEFAKKSVSTKERKTTKVDNRTRISI